jgi:hypothetical protein
MTHLHGAGARILSEDMLQQVYVWRARKGQEWVKN